jgi:hypothetical protein
MAKEVQCPSCGAAYRIPRGDDGALRCRYCDYPLKVAGSGGNVKFPRLCCRCGAENPTESWSVEFTRTVVIPLFVAVYGSQTSFCSTVPVCTTCEEALEGIDRKKQRIVLYSMLACGIAAFIWGYWDARGFGGGGILAVIGALLGWPIGAAIGWIAKGMMGGALGGIDGKRVYFYNARFQEQFAWLNPQMYPDATSRQSPDEPRVERRSLDDTSKRTETKEPTMPSYYSDWKEQTYSCDKCGWWGKGADCPQGELYRECVGRDCPQCHEELFILSFPTVGQMRDNWDNLSEGDRMQVSLIEMTRKEFAERSLRSPDQLPDLEGEELALIWDCFWPGDGTSMIGTETVIRLGDQIIWREPARYEGCDRFAEIARILKARYKSRIRDLEPTDRSFAMLYGDRWGCPDIVKKARDELRK